MRLNASWLASLARAERRRVLDALTHAELDWIAHHWPFWAREDQLPPAGAWTVWLILGGRGAGKTRTGAEWVRAEVAAGRAGRIALVGETYGDAREVMVAGPSGLGALGPASARPRYEASRKRLLFANGAVALLFSASDPEALRGPQFDAAWCDEICKWRYAEETWDMLQFGLRLGTEPRQVVTTTPRPQSLLKKLMAASGTVVSRSATAANAAHLAPSFLKAVEAAYAGTRLGRQELGGELIEDAEGALWQRDLLEAARTESAGDLQRVVVAVDPPATSGPDADECGIVAAGLDARGHGVVLEDGSARGLKPLSWAERVARLYDKHGADRIVAEVNQGGEMVAAVMRQVLPSAPIRLVRASRGKWVRAEPIAALYEQGRVAHAGRFPELEDQMCNFTGFGGGSPDRLDALVWALTELMLDAEAGRPTLRFL